MKKVFIMFVMSLGLVSIYAEVKKDKYIDCTDLPYTVIYDTNDYAKVYEDFSYNVAPETYNGKQMVYCENIDNIDILIALYGNVKGLQHMKTILCHKKTIVVAYDGTTTIYFRWNYKGQPIVYVARYQ